MSADNTFDSLNCIIQSCVKDSPPPALDFEASRCNSVTEAFTKKSFDYSEDGLNCFANCSSTEQIQISIRDLLSPLLPTSKTSLTCETRYYVQDLLTALRPVHSSNDSINDAFCFEGENLQIGNSTDYSFDYGNEAENCSKASRYVCHIRECKKVYKHPGHFKAHLNWHRGKKNFFCAHCDKGFMGKGALCGHIRVHMPKHKELKYSTQLPNKDKFIEYVEEPIIGKQNPFENHSFDVQISQNLSIPPLYNNDSGFYSTIDEFAEVKTENFVDSLNYMTSFSSFGENYQTEDSSLICKTEYFVQEPIPSSLNNRDSNRCPIVERLPEVKIEKFIDNVACTTSFSSLVPNPFHSQFLPPSPSRKKKAHPDAKISLHLSKTKDWTKYYVQDSMSPSLDNQVSNSYPTIERSPEKETENFVDEVGMLSVSTFDQKQRQNSLSPLLCDREVHLSSPDEPYSMSNTSLTSEIQSYVENKIPLKESDEIRTECQVLACNSNSKTLLEAKADDDVHDATFLTSALSRKQSSIQLSTLKKSDSISNTSSICKNRAKKQNLLSLSVSAHKLKNAPRLDNMLNHKAESCSVKESYKTKDKRVFVCIRCGKRFVHFSDDKQIDHCLKCSADGDKKVRNSKSKKQYAYSCPRCQRVFESVSTLSKHLEGHSSQENSSSGHCNEAATIVNTSVEESKPNNTCIASQASQISSIPKLQVSQEQKQTISEIDPSAESANRTTVPIFVCPRCAKRFERKDALVDHVKVRMSNNQSDSSVSQSLVLSKVRKPQKFERKKLQCPNCNGKGSFEGELQHICPESNCGKVFGTALSLKMHQNWHSKWNAGPKHFCTDCNRGFYSEYHLKLHVEIWQGLCVPACQCPSCKANGGNKTRDSKGKLRHVCHIAGCGKDFGYPKALKRHLERHGGKYFCAHCDEEFGYKVHLDSHIKEHTKVKQSKPKSDSVDGLILQSYYSLNPVINTEIMSDDVKPQHLCTVAGSAKIHYPTEDLIVHLQSHIRDHNYSLPQDFQSHISETGSYYPACDDQCRSEKSYLLDHQYSKREE